MRALLSMSSFAVVALFGVIGRTAPPALPQGAAPPSGGLDAIDVRVDPSARVVRLRRCKTETCAEGEPAKEIAIPIERERIDVRGITVETIPVGDGRRIVRARIPDAGRKDLAFEVLASGQSDEPIFAGLTGYTSGDEGDRAGNVVLVYDRDATSKFVLVAGVREDTRICGQATTPLGARGVDPKTMQLRGASLHRIEKEARDAATRIVAEPSTDARAPLGRVLFATGGSARRASALTDGDPSSAWSEERPGDGHGEFATMRAPAEVPIHALTVMIAPTETPKVDGAAPRTFFLATDSRLFHVTMPEDAWGKPGKTYRIPLPDPVKTTCVALVLDEAYTRGLGAPEVTLAEMAALTKFDVDGASLGDVAKELGGPRSDEAVALLRRSGPEGLEAVSKLYGSFDPRARALAVDVAASTGTCEGPAMDLLTRALADREAEVKKRALGRIERCGKAAGPSLAAVMQSTLPEDEPRRAAAASLLAAIAPALALEPLGDQLAKGRPETRRAIRTAFGRAAASATREKLIAFLTKEGTTPAARLDLLRALGTRVSDLRPEADAALAEVLRGSPDMATRWLALQPLAHLARTPDATSGELTRLAELAKRDPDWAVRARAVEVAAPIAPLAPTIVSALEDPAPRVREAALRAVAVGRIDAALASAEKALASDEWTFVRMAAADALGAIREGRESQNALASALDNDASPRVRAAAIVALERQRAVSHASAIRSRLDDGREDVDVRAAAARALGTMCVRSATNRLTELAHLARSPVSEADDRLGVAAIDALGALHPADLEKRLAPLRAKDVRLPVRRAADRALSEPAQCR